MSSLNEAVDFARAFCQTNRDLSFSIVGKDGEDEGSVYVALMIEALIAGLEDYAKKTGQREQILARYIEHVKECGLGTITHGHDDGRAFLEARFNDGKFTNEEWQFLNALKVEEKTDDG